MIKSELLNQPEKNVGNPIIHLHPELKRTGRLEPLNINLYDPLTYSSATGGIIYLLASNNLSRAGGIPEALLATAALVHAVIRPMIRETMIFSQKDQFQSNLKDK